MGATRTIQELAAPTRELRRAVPDAWRAFSQLHDAAMAPGALSTGTKELLALTIAAVRGCDGCIAYHARAAAMAGVTRQEVAEALAVGLLMDGGPMTSHGPRALAAFDEFRLSEVVEAADGG